METKNQ